jgi:hypothetical protein
MAAVAAALLAKISSQQAPGQRESDKPNGGAIQRRRVSEAAKSEGVPAKRVSAKRMTPKRVTPT